MFQFKRTTSDDPDFIYLVRLLDADLAARDGEDHSFYSQYNKLDAIRHVVVAFENETPVACGAIKEFEEGKMEVKRMFTVPEYRGRGIAAKVLEALEEWAAEMEYKSCVLETGKRQPEAIQLYKKCGYHIIENYGQYKGIENSVCFNKLLEVKS